MDTTWRKGARLIPLAAVTVSSSLGQVHAGLPQVEIPAEIRAWIEAKAGMRRSLVEIPKYTCSQMVERTHLNEKQRRQLEKRIARAAAGDEDAKGAAGVGSSDVARVDVAVVDGSEIYGWPGQEFQSHSAADLIGFGLMANGSLLSFARSIFVTEQAQIRFGGVDSTRGAGMLHFEYRVSLFRSGYVISTVRGEARVAFEGSIWVAEDDHRVVRLSRRAVDIPTVLGLTTATTEIEYADVPIGGSGFTLPKRAIDELTYVDGSISRNVAVFENCRLFGSETSLSFDATLEPEPVVRDVQPAPVLPVGTELRVEFKSDLDPATAKIGDEVYAELREKVALNNRVQLKKGDVVVGRIRRFQRVGSTASPIFAVALEFTELRSRGSSIRISAEIGDLPNGPGMSRHLKAPTAFRTTRRGYGWGDLTGTVETTVSEWDVDGDVDGLEMFYLTAEGLRALKGSRLTVQVVANARE